MLAWLRRTRVRAALARDLVGFRLRHGFLKRAGRGRGGGGKRVLVASITNWVCQVKQEAMLAKALQLHGYTPVIAVPGKGRLARQYFRACGFSEFVSFDALVDGTDRRRADALAERLVASTTDFRSAFGLEYRGVQLGRHLLSTVLRRRYGGRVDFADAAERRDLLAGLGEGVRLVHAAERLVDQVQPDLVLFNEKNYLPYGAVFDVALRHGLSPLQYVSAQRPGAFVFKRYTPDTRNLHPFSLSPSTWERVKTMPWSDEQGRAIVDEITAGYASGTWFRLRYRPVKGRIESREAVRKELGLVDDRPTVVVFSHVLWDATFFYGESLFDDYETWLVQTVRAACRNPALTWVIKLHPDYVYKMRVAGLAGDLPDVTAMQTHFGTLPEHVRLLLPSTSLTTVDLAQVADYAITVRGTAGMEMACFGVPVLTAGTGRYDGLGFTVDSGTTEEYLARLAELHRLPRMTSAQVELARRHAYALFMLRPCPFTTFETTYAPLAGLGHPLDHNVHVNARSAREIEEAVDLRRFAEWAMAGEPDYLGSGRS